MDEVNDPEYGWGECLRVWMRRMKWKMRSRFTGKMRSRFTGKMRSRFTGKWEVGLQESEK